MLRRRRRERRSELECFVVYMILTHSGVTRTRRTLPPASWTPLGRPRVKYTPRVSFRFDIEDRRDVDVDEKISYYVRTRPLYQRYSLEKKKDSMPTSVNSRQPVKTRPSATKGERKTKQDGPSKPTQSGNIENWTGPATDPFVAVQHRSIHTTPSGDQTDRSFFLGWGLFSFMWLPIENVAVVCEGGGYTSKKNQ